MSSQYTETKTTTTTYPTETVSSVVGDVKVSNKSYDIQGQVVDSSHDNLIDVNKLNGVQPGSFNTTMPSTGISPIVEQNTTQFGNNGNSNEPQTNKNPNQTGFGNSGL